MDLCWYVQVKSSRCLARVRFSQRIHCFKKKIIPIIVVWIIYVTHTLRTTNNPRPMQGEPEPARTSWLKLYTYTPVNRQQSSKQRVCGILSTRYCCGFLLSKYWIVTFLSAGGLCCCAIYACCRRRNHVDIGWLTDRTNMIQCSAESSRHP